MTPSEFLRLLWGDPSPLLIQLWRMNDRRSLYLKSAAGGDYYADGQVDVYTAVALAHKDHGAKTRAHANQAAAIAGLWLDIDVDGGPENKTGGVPDLTAALALAHAITAPTVLVRSGYGLHAWYLFDKPWRFRSRADQQRAAEASAQWYALHRTWAQARSWGLDHTHDLARLLRMPGTHNGKDVQPVPVTVDPRSSYARHAREQLLDLAAEAGPVDVDLHPSRPGAGAQLELAVDRDVLRAKWSALMANVDEFADAWHHRTAHGTDWTMSEWDLSLASQAALAGWTDPEIRELIRAHREHHQPGDPKARRVKYLERTVRLACESADRQAALARLRALGREAA